MTLKNRSALITQANSSLPDNETQQISPADVRNMIKDVLDSFVSKSGDVGILGVLEYGNSYTIDDGKQLVYADWVNSQILATGKFKGEWVSGPYKNGDSVLHSLLLWQANADNTGEEPGTGSSWTPQGSNQDAYGLSWIGILPIAGAALYNKFESLESEFDNIYLRLDGTFPMTGSLDMAAFDIENITSLSAESYMLQNTSSSSNGYFNATGPYMQFTFNENSLGVFDNPSRPAPQFVLYTAAGDSEVQFYTSPTNGVSADLNVVIDKNGNLKVINSDLRLMNAGMSICIGDPTVDGSWRRRIDSGDLIEEKRVLGAWVEKSRIS